MCLLLAWLHLQKKQSQPLSDQQEISTRLYFEEESNNQKQEGRKKKFGVLQLIVVRGFVDGGVR